jgi:hypothetical protein
MACQPGFLSTHCATLKPLAPVLTCSLNPGRVRALRAASAAWVLKNCRRADTGSGKHQALAYLNIVRPLYRNMPAACGHTRWSTHPGMQLVHRTLLHHAATDPCPESPSTSPPQTQSPGTPWSPCLSPGQAPLHLQEPEWHSKCKVGPYRGSNRWLVLTSGPHGICMSQTPPP